MANFEISAKAKHDLFKIYRYSHKNFGIKKADSYMQDIDDSIGLLADSPGLGRRVKFRKGYFRYDHARHSIFYKKKNARHILIVRILHNNMDSPRHI